MAFRRIVLVHYHEIGLKGRNRSSFEIRLQKNLEALLADHPVERIGRISGRICIFLEESTDFETDCTVADIAATVPGCARVSSGYVCEREMPEILDAAVAALHDAGDFTTFKVAARRNHTDFPIDSMELNRVVGARLCDEFPDHPVKMKDPDVKVCVEIIQGSAYVYARSLPGIGGLPVGTAGRAVCLLSSGIDSPVATWRIARRGAVCIGVHFSGRPQTASTSEYLVDDIAHVLEASGCIARVYIVPFGDYQRRIAADVEPGLRVIMYRRLMFRVAEAIAAREHAGALVTGESLGQVASQTMDNIGCTDSAVDMPVFRPLIGTDKQDIIRDAHRLGSFDISSTDAPDCCTLFMPRNPETHARRDVVEAAEAEIGCADWVDEILEGAQITEYACPAYRRR